MNNMQGQLAPVGRQNPAKIHNLSLGPIPSKGRAMKVDGKNIDPPLHGQPTGHGAVNTTGKKKDSPTAGPHRQPPGPRQHTGIHIGFPANFHHNPYVGLMHINGQALRISQEVGPKPIYFREL